MSEREQRVTPLELFFDLVFVFAITQVTVMMSENITWAGLGRGLLVLMALWWTWTGYAWLTNTLEPEEALVRAGMFAAMGAMLIAALTVPQAFGVDAVLFGAAYLVVRLVDFGLYAIAAKRDPEFLRAMLRFAPVALLGPVLILAAGFADGNTQLALWIVAIVTIYAAPLFDRGRGSHISPAHFAERYGLIVIIALGESIISIGFGASGIALSPGLVAAALLALPRSRRSGGRISTSWRCWARARSRV